MSLNSFNKMPLWLRIVLILVVPYIIIPALLWPKLGSTGRKIMLGVLAIFFVAVFVVSALPNEQIVLKSVNIEEGQTVKDNKVKIEFELEPDRLDLVYVNNRLAIERDGIFVVEQEFSEGENKITIETRESTYDNLTHIINFKVDLTEKKAKEAERIANLTPSEKLTEDLIAKDSRFKDGYDIFIVGQEGDKLAQINFDTESDRRNSRQFLEKMLADMVLLGREAFKVEDVSFIFIDYEAVIVDGKGNEREGSMMSLQISKEDFEEFNFDNIKGEFFYPRVKDRASIAILPSVREEIDFDNVYVDGY